MPSDERCVPRVLLELMGCKLGHPGKSDSDDDKNDGGAEDLKMTAR